MRAEPNDTTLVENNNLIGVDDGSHALGHNKDGCVRKLAVNVAS